MEQWHLVLAAVFVFLSLVTLHCSETFANPVASPVANPVASLSRAQRNKLNNDIFKHANMLTKFAQDKCNEIVAMNVRSQKAFPPQLQDYVGNQLQKTMNAIPQGAKALKFLIAARVCQ